MAALDQRHQGSQQIALPEPPLGRVSQRELADLFRVKAENRHETWLEACGFLPEPVQQWLELRGCQTYQDIVALTEPAAHQA